MTRLSWGAVGERFYEIGVDRGVLYVGEDPGVPWNGLISVTESPSGGEARSYYQDGIKYLNFPAGEEFEATILAFFSPKEFDAVDGSVDIYPGLIATTQRRKSFGLTYRTLVGNDVEGNSLGYKIHLIYNARAQPTNQANKSINDSVDPLELSWVLTTTPPAANGIFKPTAHFVIDSTTIDSDFLSAFEDVLYGTDDSAPRLPSQEEILNLYADNIDFMVIVLDASTYRALGSAVDILSEGVFTIDHERIVDNADGSFTILEE